MESVKYYKTDIEQKKSHILIYVLIGFFLVLYLAAAILIHIILGVVLALITYMFVATKTGVEIDVTNNRFRRNMILLGHDFGKWRLLPPVKYVSVVRMKESAKSFSGATATLSRQTTGSFIYNINLIVDNKKIRYIKILSARKKEALQKAILIGNALDIKVLDYTSHDKQWIR